MQDSTGEDFRLKLGQLSRFELLFLTEITPLLVQIQFEAPALW